MKKHLFLHQLFNQPLLVLPDVLHEAVAWAGGRMGINLQQVNIQLPALTGADLGQPAMQAQAQPTASQQQGVLTIPVHGILVPRANDVGLCSNQTSYESIRQQLNAGLADPAIGHIVLDLATPGGAAVGCFELAADIRAATARKPVTAIVHYTAYSAGYALAGACSEIVLSQSAGVGSIGVIIKHLDISQQLAEKGIVVTTLYRGEHKNDMASEAPLSEAALATVNTLLDRHYQQFCQQVAAHRGLDVGAVQATQAGLFFGADAVAAGLADRVESQQQTIDRIAGQLARSSSAFVHRMHATGIAMHMKLACN